jgi:hypothetical protein
MIDIGSSAAVVIAAFAIVVILGFARALLKGV